MDSTRILGLAGRAGGVYLGWKHAAHIGLPPVVGALLGYLVADLVLDQLGK